MRYKLDPNAIRIVILTPCATRKRFRLYREGHGDIKHPTLDSINEAFLSGQIDVPVARKATEDLREQIYKEENSLKAQVSNSDNLRLLEKYWESEYATRELIDSEAPKYELIRAVEALNTLSLHSATRQELQAACDKFKGSKQRRIVSALLRLLKFVGRADVGLRRAKPEKRRVKSLTEAEFLKILPYMSESLQCLHKVAFYTGARIGECFAMEEEDFDESKLELVITGQIDKKGVRRDTKNRRDRVTLVFPRGVKALKQWFKMKSWVPLEIRRKIAGITREACEKAFPGNPSKSIRFHDLRHCYAKMCRERGLSTEDVADLIGDSVIVAKEYYTGFGPTDALMSLRRKAIKK